MSPSAPHPLQDDSEGATPTAALAAVGADSNPVANRTQAAGPIDDVLTAQTLLAGRPWVGIEHNGQHYRLQTTRAGKLILTK